VDQPSTNLNLVELYDELVAFALSEFGAYGLHGSDVVFPGTEKSAEDYASDVFRGFLAGNVRVKGNRIAYLCTAVRNDIRDSARHKNYKAARRSQNSGDGNQKSAAEGVENIASSELPPDEVAILMEIEARIRALTDSVPELKEYVECVLELGLTRPADIAEFLGVSEREIYARKKKLRARAVRSNLLKVTAHG
jgi:DNA-directed RNA polymerase specialized sigma24 family protein